MPGIQSPRNTYGVPQPKWLTRAQNRPLGATVVLSCPGNNQIKVHKPPEQAVFGIKKMQKYIKDPKTPPNKKPFIEQDLERLRATTGGVAWKQPDKFIERHRASRRVYRMEEKEEILVRNFLIDTLKAARDLHRVNHTLAPGRPEERGFDLPGGGLWTDTTAAMVGSAVEFPRMSDEDVENHTDKLMAELDVRKAEDLLYLTEADWLSIDLPIGLSFLKDRLLRHVMDHQHVPSLQRASFFAAQGGTQKPVERFRNFNYADPKNSNYTTEGVAIEREALKKGEGNEIPPTGDGKGWVTAECIQSEELNPVSLGEDVADAINRSGSLPNMHGWPRGWPFTSTDVGPNGKAAKYGNRDDRGTGEWVARSVKSRSRSSSNFSSIRER